MTEETRHERGGGGLLPWLWIGAVCLVVYVLAVGPACKLADKGVVSMGVVECVYAPLQFVHGPPFVLDFFDWYLHQVWRVEGGVRRV